MLVKLSVNGTRDRARLEAVVAICEYSVDGCKRCVANSQGSRGRHSIRRDAQPGCEAGQRNVSK